MHVQARLAACLAALLGAGLLAGAALPGPALASGGGLAFEGGFDYESDLASGTGLAFSSGFAPGVPALITPKPEIEALVASVSGDSLWRTISELSGREPVVIGGVLDTLLTRFSFNWRIDHAAAYLGERFEAYGYDVSFQEFLTGKYAFNGIDFVDSNRGWVVVNTQRVYRTVNGGLTWVKQAPAAFPQDLLDVCFVDSLLGWVVGSGFSVYRTTNGGQTWAKQAATTGPQTVWTVCFLDSLNGWIAGSSGRIARTTNSGATWTSVPSGTDATICDLHFAAPNAGWAVGTGGTILFWDGASWSAQTSGTGESLLGVDFATTSVGWAVGQGPTVLKTTDGGATWTALALPSEVTYYLHDLCFADTSRGWVVGMGGTVLSTQDGGDTWDAEDIGTGACVRCVDFISPLEGWVAGSACLIGHTAAGGDAWTDQRTNLPTGAVTQNKNLIAAKPGTASAEQVIICGHYDSISETPNALAPGADDNATGVAGVREAARLLAQQSSRRTVTFLCFAGEEQGCAGSAEYAFAAHNAGDDIVGVFNLDMIGYSEVSPDSVDLVVNNESEWMAALMADCGAAYVPGLGTYERLEPYNIYSDHSGFWAQGYDGLMIMEPGRRYNPANHTTADTLGLLSKSFVTDIVRMTLASAAELALPDTVAGVPPGGRAATVAVRVEAAPNPFASGTVISIAGLSAAVRASGAPASGRVKVAIYDVEGRCLRTLVEDDVMALGRSVFWDGKDGSGCRVSPGVYFAGVTWARGTAFAKIVRLR